MAASRYAALLTTNVEMPIRIATAVILAFFDIRAHRIQMNVTHQAQQINFSQAQIREYPTEVDSANNNMMQGFQSIEVCFIRLSNISLYICE
jgi:hypothetical protein